MTQQACVGCSKPKTSFNCRVCEAALCKKCAQFVDDDRFAFMELPPEQAPTGTYCAACFEAKIVPEMQKYDEILERAGNIQVFDTTQGKESRLIKRSDVVYKVVDCEDRDETLMRLAFFAARDGYNTLVDVDLVYEKTRAGSFKIAKWSGQGVPAVVPSKYLSPPPSTRRSPSR